MDNIYRCKQTVTIPNFEIGLATEHALYKDRHLTSLFCINLHPKAKFITRFKYENKFYNFKTFWFSFSPVYLPNNAEC